VLWDDTDELNSHSKQTDQQFTLEHQQMNVPRANQVVGEVETGYPMKDLDFSERIHPQHEPESHHSEELYVLYIPCDIDIV
jgi:hypothetical protein